LSLRRALPLLAAVAVAGAVVGIALSGANLAAVGKALARTRPQWLAAAFALMIAAFLLRAFSWREVLRAALPTAVRPPFPAVVRAAMIGVMGSAVLPGRLGEPARTLLLARRLPGRPSRTIPLVAGTLLSQTVMNLIALGLLAVATFSSISVFSGREAGLIGGAAVAAAAVALIGAGPSLLRLASRSRSRLLARAAAVGSRLLADARRGLSVFAKPRHGLPAVFFQLGAWALQWLSCDAVLHALRLQHKAGLVAAAAVLLAVNVSAILPPTPSNVGIFQAACVLVLSAFGIGAAAGLAYGFALQGVEFFTALLLGVPALLAEGMGWRELREAAAKEQELLGGGGDSEQEQKGAHRAAVGTNQARDGNRNP
jgi:phosphatidylinositol alpha-mannosyltransferase